MSQEATPTQRVQAVLAAHPAPWSYIVLGAGIIKVVDARNCEVPLFTLIDMGISSAAMLSGYVPAASQPA